MFLDRAFQFASTLAVFAARHITRPAGRRGCHPQLRDLPPELLDDIALPQRVRELLQREENRQQRSLPLLFRRWKDHGGTQQF